jgi:hypothetical protein
MFLLNIAWVSLLVVLCMFLLVVLCMFLPVVLCMFLPVILCEVAGSLVATGLGGRSCDYAQDDELGETG